MDTPKETINTEVVVDDSISQEDLWDDNKQHTEQGF